MNHTDLKDNYSESSGTAMIVYSLKKGIINGWLDASYNTTINKGWDGLKKFITTYKNGKVHINSYPPGMRIKTMLKNTFLFAP